MACSPGEARAISSLVSTAGSRSIAASRSSQIRSQTDRTWADRPRASGVAARSVDEFLVKRMTDIGVAASKKSAGSAEQFGEEDGGQVALPERRDDHHDELARVLGPASDLVRSSERGAGGDAHQQTLFLGGTTRPLHGGVGVDVDDLVVDLAVEDLRHEVRTQALDLVRAGSAAIEDRGLLRLNRNDLDLRVSGLEHLPHASD